MRNKLIAGNWKMNKLPSQVAQYFEVFDELVKGFKVSTTDILFAVPFTHLDQARQASKRSGFHVAAQNVHTDSFGAFTGEVSLPMIADLGIKWTLVGHSERRQMFGESDDLVAAKLTAALKAGVTPIVCVGETLNERQGNQTEAVLNRQVSAILQAWKPLAHLPIVIAYEPVWAIGTGMTAKTEEAQAAHVLIRALLSKSLGNDAASRTLIIYGGSVNPKNTKGLLSEADIDGALVGGASLKPEEFAAIVELSQ